VLRPVAVLPHRVGVRADLQQDPLFMIPEHNRGPKRQAFSFAVKWVLIIIPHSHLMGAIWISAGERTEKHTFLGQKRGGNVKKNSSCLLRQALPPPPGGGRLLAKNVPSSAWAGRHSPPPGGGRTILKKKPAWDLLGRFPLICPSFSSRHWCCCPYAPSMIFIVD
jgi:hypothetical protein